MKVMKEYHRSMLSILLVDDDLQSLASTARMLEFSGFQVTAVSDSLLALQQAQNPPTAQTYDLVISDVRMPKLGGLEFLQALSQSHPELPVILMTAFGRIEDAVWAMKWGAVDFLIKPFKRQALMLAIEVAQKRIGPVASAGLLAGVTSKGSKKVSSSRPLLAAAATSEWQEADENPWLGESLALKQLQDIVFKVAPSCANLLLTGESGTGKERVARAVHRLSGREQKRWIALNCAAVPEALIESELFGFEKGAFTGATHSKEGLFEAADGGTLLLDEIGDMPLPLQAKLLRVLQEREVRRIGATSVKKIDVRVIAATHVDLKQAVAQGRFRQDLLYRLEVVGIRVPALRERKEDLGALAQHFLRGASLRQGKKVLLIQPLTMAYLLAYDWPGNVRELANVIERGVVLAEGPEFTPQELPPHFLRLHLPQPEGRSSSNSNTHGLAAQKPDSRGPDKQGAEKNEGIEKIEVELGTSLRQVEDLLIRKTLEATAGDKNLTAKMLGIHSRTIDRKLDKILGP